MNPWWYVLIVAGGLVYLGVFIWLWRLTADKPETPGKWFDPPVMSKGDIKTYVDDREDDWYD